ncbi:hypothetical protein AKJ18_30490, partial [Vibrio xuii]
RELLKALNLMNSKHQLTESGKLAIELGVEPRMAAMLSRSKSMKCTNTAALVAALLEEVERNTVDLLHSVHRFKQGKHSKQKVVSQRAQQLMKKLGHPFAAQDIDEQYVPVLLVAAFPGRIAPARDKAPGRLVHANG